MKFTIKYVRQLLFFAPLLVLIAPSAVSQGTDMTRLRQKSIFIGVSAVPSQSLITNKGTLAISKLLSGKMNSISGSFEIGYHLGDYYGLISGIGLVSYKSQLTLADYQSNYSTKDSENETYERRVYGTGISETQEVRTLTIPVCLFFQMPLGEKAGLYIQPGVNFAVPLGKSYRSNGTFTYKGYYAIDNVLIENLPEFGFPSNVNSTSEGNLELKSSIIYATASAGVDYFIGGKIKIMFGVLYNKSLSNISRYASTDKFQLMSDANRINSLMAGSEKVTASSIGIKIGIRYYLR